MPRGGPERSPTRPVLRPRVPPRPGCPVHPCSPPAPDVGVGGGISGGRRAAGWRRPAAQPPASHRTLSLRADRGRPGCRLAGTGLTRRCRQDSGQRQAREEQRAPAALGAGRPGSGAPRGARLQRGWGEAGGEGSRGPRRRAGSCRQPFPASSRLNRQSRAPASRLHGCVRKVPGSLCPNSQGSIKGPRLNWAPQSLQPVLGEPHIVRTPPTPASCFSLQMGQLPPPSPLACLPGPAGACPLSYLHCMV